MIAYLDYNIVTSLFDEEIEIAKIIDNVDSSIKKFPYSHAHVQEVDNILVIDDGNKADLINPRLDKISKISADLYLHQELLSNKVYFQLTSPFDVYDTITEVSFAKPAIKTMANFVSHERKRQFREQVGMDPNRINNIKPEEIVSHLNTKLTNWGTQETFMEFLEIAIGLHPDGSSFGLHSRFAAIFEFLDILGYWKDLPTKQSNVARLWDANHAFFGGYCNYFISDDKRTKMKARVVYNIYNITTNVVSSSGSD
ncbi:MAG: hypothetical protein HQ556_03230 [Candidatus Marinimicrobia bacterium]|nr:hypothetical protein [Candidatus Neomarinimicrobiota bacterium]